MNSGIFIDSEVVNVHEQIINGIHGYMILKVSDDYSSIIVDKIGEIGRDFDCFSKDLIACGQCRYGIFSVEFNNKRNLIFYLWSPENASFKDKLTYSSSKSILIKKLPSVKKSYQACERSDILFSDVMLGVMG